MFAEEAMGGLAPTWWSSGISQIPHAWDAGDGSAGPRATTLSAQ
jgi:hypothetical protein